MRDKAHMITNVPDIVHCLLPYLNCPTVNTEFMNCVYDTWTISNLVLSALMTNGAARAIVNATFPLIKGNKYFDWIVTNLEYVKEGNENLVAGLSLLYHFLWSIEACTYLYLFNKQNMDDSDSDSEYDNQEFDDPLDNGTEITEDQQINEDKEVNIEEDKKEEEEEDISMDKKLTDSDIKSVHTTTQPLIIKLLTSVDPILR